MFQFIKSLLFKPRSPFVIDHLDCVSGVVTVEDKLLGLRIEIRADFPNLVSAKITGEYEVTLHFADGRTQAKAILQN